MINYKDTERYQQGIKIMQEKYEASIIDYANNELYNFSPELADLIVNHGIVEVWTEKTPSFSLKEKELFVLSALISQGGCNDEFEGHVFNALNVGVSKNQIKELLILLTLYAGVPKVVEKIRSAIKAFEKFDASQKA
jgi:4-carboxymuconolactone decarboxylase